MESVEGTNGTGSYVTEIGSLSLSNSLAELPSKYPIGCCCYLLSFTIQSRKIHILNLGMVPSHFGYTGIIVHGMCNSCPCYPTVNRPFFRHLDQNSIAINTHTLLLTHAPPPIHSDECLSYRFQPNLRPLWGKETQGILLLTVSSIDRVLHPLY